MEGKCENLELIVANVGHMTALFCEPHPLIEYRTDLFMQNNHCLIPPDESRTIVVKRPRKAKGDLTLTQTGWRVECWNADEVVIEPDASVLLSLGRREAMCREFGGYFGSCTPIGSNRVCLKGTRPNTGRVPYLLDRNGVVQLHFELCDAQLGRAARIRLHTSDRSADTPTRIRATLNGRRFGAALPRGLGIQKADPAHLAFPATTELAVPADVLRPGDNRLELGVQGDGWFSWDALDLLTRADDVK